MEQSVTFRFIYILLYINVSDFNISVSVSRAAGGGTVHKMIHVRVTMCAHSGMLRHANIFLTTCRASIGPQNFVIYSDTKAWMLV